MMSMTGPALISGAQEKKLMRLFPGKLQETKQAVIHLWEESLSIQYNIISSDYFDENSSIQENEL